MQVEFDHHSISLYRLKNLMINIYFILFLLLHYIQVMVWLDRASNFHTLCEEVNHCFNHLTEIPNRPLLYDLYQYMSDARETTMLLDSYISWLG